MLLCTLSWHMIFSVISKTSKSLYLYKTFTTIFTESRSRLYRLIYFSGSRVYIIIIIIVIIIVHCRCHYHRQDIFGAKVGDICYGRIVFRDQNDTKMLYEPSKNNLPVKHDRFTWFSRGRVNKSKLSKMKLISFWIFFFSNLENTFWFSQTI